MAEFLCKCYKERRREETKQKLLRGVDVNNILAGLLLVLGTGAIIIVTQTSLLGFIILWLKS